jgi:hypothetical protein
MVTAGGRDLPIRAVPRRSRSTAVAPHTLILLVKDRLPFARATTVSEPHVSIDRVPWYCLSTDVTPPPSGHTADSFWTYLDGVESVNRVTYVATGFRLQPAWTYRPLRPSPTLFRQGTHTITLAEREDGTRMRRVGISMGYPVCQFGAPPAAPNNTADSVLARVLTLETQTNNRVSAMSTGSAALNATVQALSASVSSSQSMVMVSVSQQVSTLRASVLSTTNSLQSQVTAQASTGTAVSTAMSSLSARLGTVGAFGTGGGGGALPAAPQLGRSGRDVAIAAGAGGTVRIQGAQCQSDLCSLVSQVSQLTDALRQT